MGRIGEKLRIILKTISADSCFLVYEDKGKIDSITVGDVSEYYAVVHDEDDEAD